MGCPWVSLGEGPRLSVESAATVLMDFYKRPAVSAATDIRFPKHWKHHWGIHLHRLKQV